MRPPADTDGLAPRAVGLGSTKQPVCLTKAENVEPELPAWLWMWIPIAFVASIPLARVLAPEFHGRWFNHKEGPIEWLTVLVLVVGIGAGVRALSKRKALPDARLRWWLVLHILAAVYVAGEELSWGQTVFAWKSPELMERVNAQHETNLHNTSSWFNEKPRLAFELWVLYAGIVLPLLRRRRPHELGGRGWWFWPTFVCLPTAVAGIVLRVPDRIEKWIGEFKNPVLADLRLSEPQELLFAYFLMLFLLSFYVRLRALEQVKPEPAAPPRDQARTPESRHLQERS